MSVGDDKKGRPKGRPFLMPQVVRLRDVLAATTGGAEDADETWNGPVPSFLSLSAL